MSSIALTRYISEAHESGQLPRQQSWPITITAVGVDMPSEIFVYHIDQEGDPLEGDIFEAVASPQQLYELPANAAAVISSDDQIPYYRRSVLEFLARSADEAQYIWETVQEEVAILVRDFNAGNTLLGIERVQFSASGVVQQSLNMQPPTRHLLSYHPCGVAVFSNDTQSITGPYTPELDGWLPVSQAPGGFVAPFGAVLFYNIDQDATLKSFFPLPEPWSGHLFTRNGILLQEGLHYRITEKTIWWLAFDPATISGYERLVDQVGDFNLPWPSDYANRSNPGDTTVNLTLQIFR